MPKLLMFKKKENQTKSSKVSNRIQLDQFQYSKSILEPFILLHPHFSPFFLFLKIIFTKTLHALIKLSLKLIIKRLTDWSSEIQISSINLQWQLMMTISSQWDGKGVTSPNAITNITTSNYNTRIMLNIIKQSNNSAI